MYEHSILNDFYQDLFASDFKGYDSAVQNEKTDSLALDPDLSFEDWLDNLVETYCEEFGDDADELHAAIEAEPAFLNDMHTEFDELKDLLGDLSGN